MPANYNYDMIVSQSPPSIFSHSPPAGFLTDYMSTYRRPFEPPGFSRHHHHHNHHHSHHSHHHQPFSHHHHQPQPGNVQPRMLKSLQLKMASATIPTPKSCLAKHDHHADASDVDETDHVVNGCVSEGIRHSAMVGGKAKRVVFADDKGLELTHVKIMSEPSNVPPYWTLQFLAEVTHGLISPVAITEQWEVDFKQPASDYLGFRQVLEERKVSLENVIVRESESIVVGTVKVRNLSFNKEVIVRVTYDKWKSQEDIQCTYSNLGGPPVAGAYALYDTFAFKLTLPPASKRSVEFCVCFRCDGQDYWDNNNGQNYTLSKRVNGTTSDSILTNAPSSNPASKLTIIQDLKGSWNTGTLSAAAEDQHQPYW